MVFNSLPFLVFFGAFFLLYWLVFGRSVKAQNGLLLAGSYFFYGYSSSRFLLLLLLSSLLNYALGLAIARSDSGRRKKLLLNAGLLVGLGGLLLFKYYDFFALSVKDALEAMNIHASIRALNLVMPLGISFYTFRNMSYLLDVDKGKVQPCTSALVYLNYVSFFPGLISGPIDKAKTLVPQLESPRAFSYEAAADGLRQILWGLFKKMVIADNCARFTDHVFEDHATLPGSSLLLGCFFYTIQIYADFSGYSDMAIGVARLLGFSITRNFDYPFFSQNIAEFWRKWHISLTSWLTEYVFTPLTIAFRNYDNLGLIMAILINFTLVGIWHGANWTFVLFGFLHGCFYIPLILKGTINKKKTIARNRLFPTGAELLNVCLTFVLVMLAFIVFRSDSIRAALGYFGGLFSLSLFSVPQVSSHTDLAVIVLFTVLMFAVEWVQRNKQHALQFVATGTAVPGALQRSRPLRWSVYLLLIFTVFCFGGSGQDFIYFRF